jgi:hypothetical protein
MTTVRARAVVLTQDRVGIDGLADKGTAKWVSRAAQGMHAVAWTCVVWGGN